MNPPSPPAFLPLPPLPRLPLRRLRTAPTLTLSDPHGLPNLRDLSTAAPHLLRPSLLYRGSTPSALPATPSPSSLHFLRTAPLLLDLRSPDERRADRRDRLALLCGPDFRAREAHVPLLRKRSVVLGLARALPPDQARALVWHILARPVSVRASIVARVDQGGLVLLNRILVDAGAAAIGRALSLVVDALDPPGDGDDPPRPNGPVYFYCSAGKDRTGLLAALILSVLGVDRYAVVSDYVKSRETWENGPYRLREDYCARLEDAGLTPLQWLGAPPEVMDETLRFIDRSYGSVEDYLIHCGFQEQNINRLRAAMAIS